MLPTPMTTVALAVDSLPDLDDAVSIAADLPAQLGDTHLNHGQVAIVPNLDLTWSISLDHRTSKLAALVRGVQVWSATVTSDQPSVTWQGNQGLVKESITLTLDFGRGEIVLSGDVCVRELQWQCYRFTDHVLVAWSPTLGAVGGDVIAHPPQVDDGASGASSSIVPTITRIPVDAQPRIGTPVGAMVKAALFADRPDFVFNVCFAVGPFKPFRAGAYGDPSSPWSNVFVGYYQIDCPKPAWTRPFGYQSSVANAAIAFDDIIRIGKADWNYFSNWMYGVPIAVVTPFDAPDPGVVCTTGPRTTIAGRQWDVADVDGFATVSAYQATGSTQLVDNTVLTPLWRVTYGEARNVAGYPTSFVGATMHARLYMAFAEDDDNFHTYLFGGTVNKAFDTDGNTAFLAAQMAASAEVITAHYPTLGFAAAPTG
jgi:hypothetical protein